MFQQHDTLVTQFFPYSQMTHFKSSNVTDYHTKRVKRSQEHMFRRHVIVYIPNCSSLTKLIDKKTKNKSQRSGT